MMTFLCIIIALLAVGFLFGDELLRLITGISTAFNEWKEKRKEVPEIIVPESPKCYVEPGRVCGLEEPKPDPETITGEMTCLGGTGHYRDMDFPPTKIIGGVEFTRRTIEYTPIEKKPFSVEYKGNFPNSISLSVFKEFCMNLSKALNEKYGQVSYTDRFSNDYDEAWGIEVMYGKKPDYPSLKIKLYTFFAEPNYRVLTITYIVNEERCEAEIRDKYKNKITTNEI